MFSKLSNSLIIFSLTTGITRTPKLTIRPPPLLEMKICQDNLKERAQSW